MGILSKSNNSNNGNKTTKGLNFGTAQAEGECIEKSGHRINPYFTDFLDILSEIENNKFLIVGRKGTGKSAIAQFIENESDKAEDSFAHSITVSTIEIERIIQLTKSKEGEPMVYEWLILLYLTKLIVKSGSAKYSNAIQKLSNFLSKNTGSVEIDQKQMVEILEKREGHIDINMLKQKFQHLFGTSTKSTNPLFVNLLTPLKEIICTALRYQDLQDKEFFILFDDLDVDFDLNNDAHCKRLMSLIRTVSSMNNRLPANAKILLFLRDDVVSHLTPKYNDSAKIIESHKVVINWYIHNLNKINEDDVPLKKMVNQRVKIAFKNKGITIPQKITPWDFLIEENIGYPKSSFKHILDFTFYKPRDLVLLLNTISDDAYKYPLANYDIDKVLTTYCYRLKNEVLSELTLYFNEKEKKAVYDHIFQHIANNIRDRKNTIFSKLATYINNLNIFNRDGNEVIKILWSYSLIGYKDNFGNIYYNHREENYPNMIKDACIELPNCIKRLYKL